jgi:malonyl-CoA O-methyltransferase
VPIDDPTLAVLRDGYDELADGYLEWWTAIEGYSGIVEEFLARHVRPGCAVLDVGCGPGQLTAGVAPTVRVVGVDLSPAMVAAARAARPGGVYVEHDYRVPLPAELGTFDVVVAVGALDFCDDLDAVLGHVAAAIRAGGAVLLSVVERLAADPASRPIHPERMPGVDMYLYDRAEVVEALSRHGLAPVRSTHLAGYYHRYWQVHVPYAVFEATRTGR